MYHTLAAMTLPEIPEREILARLGFNFHKTQFSPEEWRQFRSLLAEAFRLAAPCGRWTQLNVVQNNGDELVFDNGMALPGRDFPRWIGDAPEIWVGAVTIGAALPAKVAELTPGNMAHAAIFDAAASEIADAAMDFLQHYAMRHYLRQGRHLHKRRYSPGYGDMPLSVQQDIFALLDLPGMGLALSENYIISPEKSVTAFAGLSDRLQP